MGYEDREYYREDYSPGGYQLGGELSITARIVIINAVLFLVNLFVFSGESGSRRANFLTDELLAMHADTLAKPWLWYQLLSYGFAHDPQNIGHIFWNMFSLIMFGGMIERALGGREYLRFYLLSIVVGGIVWGTRMLVADYNGILSVPEGYTVHEAYTMLGASGGITAVIILFCLRNPNATVNLMMILPVPAWVLGVILVVGDLMQVQGRGVGVAYDVHLAGAFFAIAYFHFDWRLSRLPGLDWFSKVTSKVSKMMRPKPPLKVFDGDDDDAAYRELEQQADRILDKISKEGESSLSDVERKLLERYSRLMRQKHR